MRPMGAPTSEVGYTSATTRRGEHEVYMDMWRHEGGGVKNTSLPYMFRFHMQSIIKRLRVQCGNDDCPIKCRLSIGQDGAESTIKETIIIATSMMGCM
jgi:hypothetical protein